MVMVTAAREAATLAAAKAPGQRDLQITDLRSLLHLLGDYFVSGPAFDRKSHYAPLEVRGNVVSLNSFSFH